MMIDHPQLPMSPWTQLSVANRGCASTVKMPKSTVRSRRGPVAASCDCNLGPTNNFSRNCALAPAATSVVGPVALSRYSLSRTCSWYLYG